MAKKEFNAEEIVELRENSLVSSIIYGRIFFTPEYKHVAYSQLVPGKSIREIFENQGIDPDILGSSGIWGFAENSERMPIAKEDSKINELTILKNLLKSPRSRRSPRT